MKRSRDEDDDSDAGRSSVRRRTSGGSANSLAPMDIPAYLKEIRETFQDEKEKFAEFLDVMKDFKAHRVDIPSIIARVSRIFEGYPDLILGFKALLPKEYKITIDEPQAKKPMEFDEAFQFVRKIKTRFQGDERSYSSFLSILSMYKNNSKSASETYQEVAALLRNQPDKLKEFANFFPSKQYVHSSRNHNRSPVVKKRALSDEMPQHANKKMRMEDREHRSQDRGFDHNQPDELGEFANFLPSGQYVHSSRNHNRSPVVKKRALSVEMPQHANKRMRREDTEHHSPDRGFDHHRTNHLTHKRKPTSALEDSVPSLKKLEDSVAELLHGDMRDEVLCVREKVKRRLNDSDNYRKLLSCIVHYSTRDITRSALENMVKDILGAYPDLMEEVNGFIDRSESADDEDQDRERVVKNVSVIEDEYQAKPIHELDLSDCPSYRRLPKDYPIPKASARTKEAAKVLNDHWVSVASGGEDHSFKHKRKNQYEESLFRCEDDRYELDMLIKSAKGAAKSVEKLLKKIDNNFFNTDSEINLEEHLTVLNLRCIERLYGDYGLEVLDVLKNNPSLALPVILIRLKQKQEEWERFRSDSKKIWADVYAKNHQKALDHRRLYFKQQDSKSSSAEELLAETKEISEDKAKEENNYDPFCNPEKKDHCSTSRIQVL